MFYVHLWLTLLLRFICFIYCRGDTHYWNPKFLRWPNKSTKATNERMLMFLITNESYEQLTRSDFFSHCAIMMESVSWLSSVARGFFFLMDYDSASPLIYFYTKNLKSYSTAAAAKKFQIVSMVDRLLCIYDVIIRTPSIWNCDIYWIQVNVRTE